MARPTLTYEEKRKKERRHSMLRAFLAKHQIKLGDAAEFYGYDYYTFQVCLNGNKFSNDTIEELLEKKEELLTDINN